MKRECKSWKMLQLCCNSKKRMVAAVALLAGSLLNFFLVAKANWPQNEILIALRPLNIGNYFGVESVEKPSRGYSRQVKTHRRLISTVSCLYHPLCKIHWWHDAVSDIVFNLQQCFQPSSFEEGTHCCWEMLDQWGIKIQNIKELLSTRIERHRTGLHSIGKLG